MQAVRRRHRLQLTRSGDKGTWGRRSAYRKALRRSCKANETGHRFTQPAGYFVPTSPCPRQACGSRSPLWKHLPTWQIVTPIERSIFRTAWHVFSNPVVGENTTMNPRRPINYLRSHRLRWGLSQKELAYLLGWDRPDVISRIEKKQRPPTLALAMACFILFGTSAPQLFPDMSASIEAFVMARVWEMYETIQGDPSRRTKKKIELLEDAIARADRRKHAAAYDIAKTAQAGARDLFSNEGVWVCSSGALVLAGRLGHAGDGWSRPRKALPQAHRRAPRIAYSRCARPPRHQQDRHAPCGPHSSAQSSDAAARKAPRRLVRTYSRAQVLDYFEEFGARPSTGSPKTSQSRFPHSACMSRRRGSRGRARPANGHLRRRRFGVDVSASQYKA